MVSISPTAADPDPALNDLGPLAWVLDELRKSLDGASKAMHRFVRDAELARGSELSELDSSHLRVARQQLHQAAGALEMVGLPAPAQMLHAMETLVQKYVQRPEQCSDAAALVIERASFALVEYLEAVLKGKPVSSVALFPQFRAVQELVGSDRLHPADLWTWPWQWREVPLDATHRPLRYVPELRPVFDQAVLQVVKTADAPSAAKLTLVCAALSVGQVGPEALAARSFWALAAGFLRRWPTACCPRMCTPSAPLRGCCSSMRPWPGAKLRPPSGWPRTCCFSVPRPSLRASRCCAACRRRARPMACKTPARWITNSPSSAALTRPSSPWRASALRLPPKPGRPWPVATPTGWPRRGTTLAPWRTAFSSCIRMRRHCPRYCAA